MEILIALFEGRARLSSKPEDDKPYTFISFMPNHGLKENGEIRQAVRGTFGFTGNGMYFQGWINFNRDQLALLRQFRIKHKHEGKLQVTTFK